MKINLNSLTPNETLEIVGGDDYFVLDLYRMGGKWVFQRYICLPSDLFHTDPDNYGRILERSYP